MANLILENIDWNSEIDMQVESHSKFPQPLRLDLTSRIQDAGTNPSTRVYHVKLDYMKECYIIDNPDALKVSCQPHIVGKELISRMYSAAIETISAMRHLTDFDNDGTEKVIEHVLRACSGYQTHEAYKDSTGKKMFEVWVRPRYVKPSYRAHDSDERKIEIVYEDFTELPSNADLTLVIFDTYASSKSGVASIDLAVKKAKENGSKIKKAMVGGFIAEKGLKIFVEKAKEYDIDVAAFPLVALTGICNNFYDMTLFGPDEKEWENNKNLNLVGSIVDRETLYKAMQKYVPGIDIVGDWSDRQEWLWKGNEWEHTDLRNHLNKSVKIINNLLGIDHPDWKHPEWQKEIARRELDALERSLREYKFDSSMTVPQASS